MYGKFGGVQVLQLVRYNEYENGNCSIGKLELLFQEVDLNGWWKQSLRVLCSKQCCHPLILILFASTSHGTTKERAFLASFCLFFLTYKSKSPPSKAKNKTKFVLIILILPLFT